MRQRRAKTYRKLMGMYHETFGFHTPFQILMDSQFCVEASRSKLLDTSSVMKLMSRTVQDECKLMIPQCSITEMYKHGPKEQHTVDMAKTFERNKCNHRDAISSADCIASIIGTRNKNRYVVATQNDDLRSKMRSIPGVPIIHLKRGVLVLEPPSQATLEKKTEIENSSLHAKKGEVPTDDNGEPIPVKKVRGAKAPNPLSTKKKVVKPPLQKKEKPKSESGSKRKRVEEGEDGAVEEGTREPKKRRRRRAGPRAGAEGGGGGSGNDSD